MSDARLVVLAADIGKTRTRLQLTEPDGAVRWAIGGDGVAGLAAPGADEAIAQRIVDLAAGGSINGIDAVAVGVAGAIAAPDAAESLAARLAAAFGSRAIVASDIVTAHLGALGGAEGATLVAGTGAVTMGIAADGTTTIVDGHGPEVGDLGGGAWIGRAGITAAMRANDGVEPSTGLQSALERFLGPRADLQSWLADAGNLGGRLGAFAPAVLDLAEGGDPAATAIADDAARLLTATTVAAGSRRVAVLGGLVAHPWFRACLIRSLSAAGLDPHRPIGTALHGARIAAVSEHLPHERHLHRA